MDQCPSWETSSHSAIKKFPTSYETWRFITVVTKATTGPYPEPDECSSHLPALFP